MKKNNGIKGNEQAVIWARMYGFSGLMKGEKAINCNNTHLRLTSRLMVLCQIVHFKKKEGIITERKL